MNSQEHAKSHDCSVFEKKTEEIQCAPPLLRVIFPLDFQPPFLYCTNLFSATFPSSNSNLRSDSDLTAVLTTLTKVMLLLPCAINCPVFFEEFLNIKGQHYLINQ